MNTKNDTVVHIGMGKCATTTLQHSIFPLLCKEIGYKWWLDDLELAKRVNQHKVKMKLGFETDSIDIPLGTFISYEPLFAHTEDPGFYEEYAEKNLQAFGKDAHILITVRHPKSYLSSVYLQSLKSGSVQKPKYYFIEKKYYSKRLRGYKFSVDDFSYDKLIKLYTDRFEKVSVVKYEFISSMDFLVHLFGINKELLNKLQHVYLNQKHNRGYSHTSVKLLFVLSNVLEKIHLTLAPSNITNIAIDTLKDVNNQKKYSGSERSLVKMLLFEIFKIFRWSFVLEKIIPKIFPYKKYELNLSELPWIDISRLIDEYDNIPEMITIRRES